MLRSLRPGPPRKIVFHLVYLTRMYFVCVCVLNKKSARLFSVVPLRTCYLCLPIFFVLSATIDNSMLNNREKERKEEKNATELHQPTSVMFDRLFRPNVCFILTSTTKLSARLERILRERHVCLFSIFFPVSNVVHVCNSKKKQNPFLTNTILQKKGWTSALEKQNKQSKTDRTEAAAEVQI